MLRSIFTKTLYQKRWMLLAWGLGILSLGSIAFPDIGLFPIGLTLGVRLTIVHFAFHELPLPRAVL